MHRTSTIAIASTLLFAACGKSSSSPTSGSAAPPVGSAGSAAKLAGGAAAPTPPFSHPVLAKWTQAGLTVSAFSPDVSGKLGKDCNAGTVNGVDVVLCKFADAKAATAAEPAALTWIDQATGAALANGEWQLVVVDRNNADPSGRTINAVAKAFR